MTEHIDPRPGWVLERTYELQLTGLSYDSARAQAESEAEDEFSDGHGDNGNGSTG